jgi:hypothetical protein
MLGWFNEKKIQELLSILKNRRIGLVITLGYAPDDYKLQKKSAKLSMKFADSIPIRETGFLKESWIEILS